MIALLIAKRLGLGLVTLFIISLIVFFSVQLLPGDVAQAILGRTAPPEAVAALRTRLGLDLPAHVRYLQWAGGLFQGDFGDSLANRRPVLDLLSERIGNTFFLAAVSACIAVPLGLILGLASAIYRSRSFDHATSLAALLAISVPEFLTAYILVAIFAVELGWLPAVSMVQPSQGILDRFILISLPAATLALGVIAYILRMTRAAIGNVLSSPYIEMAKLKGVSPYRLVVRHALPNALSPIINVVLMNLAYLVVGVVVVEVIFVYPGLGQLLVDSVSKRDIPVVQACGVLFATAYILLNLLADVLSILANPRLRRPRGGV
ncbi:ABC transporter permease [Pseudaminobacter salicylatoxidans]|uniref:ABC transporter permease n=1 Tax=Pseudaminobacter salicylatoxidans TaxID=93369 RepID=UPI0002F4C6B8|nr:ABC transporter permease [Pseudaminobacter salicylatoxidans]